MFGLDLTTQNIFSRVNRQARRLLSDRLMEQRRKLNYRRIKNERRAFFPLIKIEAPAKGYTSKYSLIFEGIFFLSTNMVALCTS